MDIEALINKMKVIHQVFMDYIDTTDDIDGQFKKLIETLRKQEILDNNEETQLLFQLISKITDSHHRTSIFFNKLEKILEYLKEVNVQI